jgi:TatA/E family protein of Tat protein translocase
MPFGIGPGELVIVLIIALIVVGPGKLPDVGSALGKSIREFRKASADVVEATSLDVTKTPAPAAPAPAPLAPAPAAAAPMPVPAPVAAPAAEPAATETVETGA